MHFIRCQCCVWEITYDGFRSKVEDDTSDDAALNCLKVICQHNHVEIKYPSIKL